MTTRGGRWVVALGLAGCSPAAEATLPEDGADTGVEEPGETGLDDESSTGSVEDESTGADDDGLDESGEDSSTGDAPAVCGNGIVEDGEGCDEDSPQCHSDCQRVCTLMLEVNGASDRYDALSVGEDGTIRVVGTTFVGEDDSDVFVTSLDAELAEGERWVVEATEQFELARALVAHGGDEFTTLRLRDDDGAPLNTALDVIRHTDGEVLWVDELDESISPSFFFGESDAAALADGGVAVTTTFLPEDGGRQILVARFAADGTSSTTVVDTMVEGTPFDRANLLLVGPDGTITVAGSRSSELGGFGVLDPLVVQIGPNDEPTWSWSEWTGATNLQLDPRGAAVDGAGRTAFSFDLDHSSPPDAHAWIIVFEPDGKIAWQLDTDDLDEDAREGGPLLFDAQDRLVQVAIARSEAGGFSNPRIRVTGFGGEGTVLCDEALNDTVVNVNDVALDADGSIVAVGYGIDEDFESYTGALRIRGLQ